jgi:uncharacterized protein YneR
MRFFISNLALKWFKDEMGITAGDKIRFYAKFYGSSPMQQGYSLGFSKGDDPIDMAVSNEMDGILFFIEDSDVWYFDGHDLHVDYNEKQDELEYKYIKP